MNVNLNTPQTIAREAAATGVHQVRTPIWTPLLLLAVGSVAFRFSDLDLVVQRWFWLAEGGWKLEDAWLVNALYAYGTYPALFVAAGGLIICIASFFVLRLRPARHLSGLLAFAMIIGPACW